MRNRKRTGIMLLLVINCIVFACSIQKPYEVYASEKVTINSLESYANTCNGMYFGSMECYMDASGTDLEYKWCITSDNGNTWSVIYDWCRLQYLSYTAESYGEYIITCMVREKDQPDTMAFKSIEYSYHPYLKGKCQMPYDGEGGGYLIGCETNEGTDAYTAELLVLDCTLLAQAKDAWVYTTTPCGITNNSLWTVWQPLFGYYWTLFRVYDGNGTLVDSYCYGFQNVDAANIVPEEDKQLQDICPLGENYANKITVEGVNFDMHHFKEKITIKNDAWGSGSETLWVQPDQEINPSDLVYVINDCELEFLASKDTYNVRKDDYLVYDQYYVGGWDNMMAYSVIVCNDQSSFLWQEGKYRCELYNGFKTGTFDVSVYYKGTLLRTCKVSVESTNESLTTFRELMNNIESEVWTDTNMSVQSKLRAVSSYVREHYMYSDGYRCNFGAEVLYYAAKDLGLNAHYRFVGPNYDYQAGYGDVYYVYGAGSYGGHVCTVVTIDGKECIYETQGK